MIAMDTHDDLKSNEIRGEIFALVHDSIIGACHKDDVDKMKQLLLKNTVKDRGVSIPNCPIGVDFGYGESYAAAG
jgi:DNA polymerase I-like protein with 3'-5' exonuclease and polymerase domains